MSPLYAQFLQRLQDRGFTGDVERDYAQRFAQATDNSIYQLLPEAVLYPTSTDDLQLMMQLLAEPKFHNVVISGRGGGTGTNAQSLTNGIMVDTSRHMNRILEINPQERWARVQCGVVKDQLNEAIAPHGLFFAPETSTSNRCTIGGMVNTDASGQGSVIYGKTRHHVLEMVSVLHDGSLLHSAPKAVNGNSTVESINQQLQQLHHRIKDDISRIFPNLNRNLTGYDLANLISDNGEVNFNALLCGSEGTLALTSEIKINLLPIPKKSALVLVFYPSFQQSLQDAQALMSGTPDAIETIDSKVLEQARRSKVWHSVQHLFPVQDGVDGINFVELLAETDEQLDDKIARFETFLQSGKRSGFTVVKDAADINQIWNVRKLSVGLLGNVKGDARPIAFVEDVAVPPEQLANFIEAFRTLLDEHGLYYGMFGHVDAGVLHVRPAINMKDPQQAKLIRTLTDQVAQLTKNHGGILWGEHGKGVRSEYAPLFFAELYPALQTIKALFDPHNQLNPGKIATPSSTIPLLKIDEVTTRGEQDRLINDEAFKLFASGLYCNGNGACFNYHPNSLMCPTWKATGERNQSPKGRSGLVRDWLRQQSLEQRDLIDDQRRIRRQPLSLLIDKAKHQLQRWQGKHDFSHDVYEALDHCMSCKSCAGQCPIEVNIPDMRSHFFELYHGRYFRPLQHHVAGWLEPMLPWLAKIKSLYNSTVNHPWIDALSKLTIGLQDIPSITHSDPTQAGLDAGAQLATPELLASLPAKQRSRTVIIIQDAFTSFFETPLLIDTVKLLNHLGYLPLVAPFQPNGKVLHVYGFLGRFEKVARTHGADLQRLAQDGVTLMGIDAATTLTYQDEYRHVLGDNAPPVLLMSEWLAQELPRIQALNIDLSEQAKEAFVLLGHCTETSNKPESPNQWVQFFAALGLTLRYQPTGCCGMAGIYGHESRHVDNSKKLYEMSWQEPVTQYRGRVLATGYSCRSQVKRFDGEVLRHPIQAVVQFLSAM